jgi:hypothetical protein
VKRVALLIAALFAVGTAGYATAAEALRVIRLYPGQSVRIGTVKVVAVGKTRVVTKTGPTTTVTGANECTTPVPYPGDYASREAIAQWMASGAQARRVPAELPLMAALVESGLRNLKQGDTDAAGYFAMRVSIWNSGKYAGFPDRPDLQLTWFLDQAIAVWAARVRAGDVTYGIDPYRWGDWAADVMRPAVQYRSRYQLRLDEARGLIGASCSGAV